MLIDVRVGSGKWVPVNNFLLFPVMTYPESRDR